MMATSADVRPPFIGSYVLETLTTGMYGESRNALREYVQNSFDAIRSAVAAGLMTLDVGRIDVLLAGPNSLVIQDNGVGLGSASAWGTLTAIGASKKDRKRDAGFRGIGRLAGIAFCDRLSFTTKAAGENVETTVTFDCLALREGMSPESGGEALVELLQRTVTATVNSTEDSSQHYMTVTLQGLAAAPDDFKDLNAIRAYLAETSPVPFDPDWEMRARIAAEAQRLQKPIEEVALFIGETRETATQIYKRYRSSYATADGVAAIINGLEFYSDEQGHWWGWVGIPDRPGLLKDKLTHGLRFRVKNIQVDGTMIFDRLFARKNESYDRFNRYYIGEVHVTPDLLIPNARRDGFEDNAAWNQLEASLFKTICTPLTRRAYKLSKGRQSQMDVIERKVTDLTQEIDAAFSNGNSIQEEAKVTLLYNLTKVRSQVAKAVKDADPETKVQLTSHLEVLDQAQQKLSGVDSERDRIASRKTIREELLAQVLEIIQPYLEPSTFAKVRKLLREKLR
jgi:hypothetical protein